VSTNFRSVGVRWTGPRLIVTRASKPVLDLFEEAGVVSDRDIKSA
jgi:hypothetical protein